MSFSFGQFEIIFDLRDADGKPYILIGGQAVNYWAEKFLNAEPELIEWLPFTSSDIDYYGNRDDVSRVAAGLGLPAYFPPGRGVTALSGTVPFKIDGLPAYIEMVRLVPGLASNKIQSWAVAARRGKNEIRVLDPVSLLVCKINLALTVDQKQRRDVEHLRILVICVRAFLRETLQGVTKGELPARGWLGAVERVLKLGESAIGKKAAHKFDLNWTDALPEKEIAASKLPLVGQLRQKRLPQWREKQNQCAR
jgi:hypothetical protein